MTDQDPGTHLTNGTTNGDAPPLTLEQMERMVRERIERIDAEIAEHREARRGLDAKIKQLLAEREQATRMLPRTPRKRQTSS